MSFRSPYVWPSDCYILTSKRSLGLEGEHINVDRHDKHDRLVEVGA